MVVQFTAQKCTKKRDARAKLLFCLVKLLRLVGWLDAPWRITPPNESHFDPFLSYITHDLSTNPPLVIMVWSFFPPIPHHSMRLVMIVWGGFRPILAHSIRYKTVGFLTFLISWCPFCSTVSLREVGLLVYSQGFAISREEYIIRELAFCDWTGHHHVLFKYTLPLVLTYDLLSEDAETRVDRQTKTVHGLPFEPFCRITTDTNFILTIS